MNGINSIKVIKAQQVRIIDHYETSRSNLQLMQQRGSIKYADSTI